MNYNPTYPVFVKYNVSQDVWAMHDIYVWHFLLRSFGTKKTFKYLQYRLEHNQSMYPVVSFLCIVFLVTWLVTFWLRFSSFRREPTRHHQNPVTLLKRFILTLYPTLNFLVERRALLHRIRERQATRVIISQPVASAAASNGPMNGGRNGSGQEVRPERSRRPNLKRQPTTMNRTNNQRNRERTDNDSNNSVAI